MDFGTIESIEIAQNLESGEDVRIAQVNITGEDTVSVELPFPEGDEFCPDVGDTVFFVEVDPGYILGQTIQSVAPVESDLGTGEREIFSRDGEGRSAKIRLKNDGTLVFNDGTDFAVRFEKLESALDTMLTELNNTITVLKTHKHATAGTGSPSPPVEAANIKTVELDITDSKVEKVQL